MKSLLLALFLVTAPAHASLGYEFVCEVEPTGALESGTFHMTIAPNGTKLTGLWSEHPERVDRPLTDVVQFKFVPRTGELYVWYQPEGVGSHGFRLTAPPWPVRQNGRHPLRPRPKNEGDANQARPLPLGGVAGICRYAP